MSHSNLGTVLAMLLAANELGCTRSSNSDQTSDQTATLSSIEKNIVSPYTPISDKAQLDAIFVGYGAQDSGCKITLWDIGTLNPFSKLYQTIRNHGHIAFYIDREQTQGYMVGLRPGDATDLCVDWFSINPQTRVINISAWPTDQQAYELAKWTVDTMRRVDGREIPVSPAMREEGFNTWDQYVEAWRQDAEVLKK